MAAEALRGGARRRAAYRRLGQALAYGHLRKSTGRLGSGLPRVRIGLRWSAAGSMAGSGGGAQLALGSGMMERASEFLDHTGSSVVDLRTQEVGQLNLRNAGGDELTEVSSYRSLGARRDSDDAEA